MSFCARLNLEIVLHFNLMYFLFYTVCLTDSTKQKYTFRSFSPLLLFHVILTFSLSAAFCPAAVHFL